MYKLSRDATGLCCTENGLTYGSIALVAKTGSRFQPCRPEIDSLAKAGLAVSPTGLQSVANFLNRNNLGGAMIAALHLRLPDLDELAQLVKAGFDPSQPRDEDGMWTSDGGDGEGNNNDADSDNPDSTASSGSFPTPPAIHPAGTQYADSGQTMTDASPTGPTPAPASGTSNLNIDNAVNFADSHAAATSQNNCASAVENALSAGGVDLPRTVELQDAKAKGAPLLAAGFAAVPAGDMKTYVPQKGDVLVMQNYAGGNPAGHMSIFNGSDWVSDFRENHGTNPYPGLGYRNNTPQYTIYRP